MKYDFTKVTGYKNTPTLVFYIGNEFIVGASDIFLKDTPLATIEAFEKRAPAYKAEAVAYFNGKLEKQ